MNKSPIRDHNDLLRLLIGETKRSNEENPFMTCEEGFNWKDRELFTDRLEVLHKRQILKIDNLLESLQLFSA
jgi:hypothetical protein